MHNYPSDITRKQFEIIRPILESSRKKTSPRTVDLHQDGTRMMFFVVYCIFYPRALRKKRLPVENVAERLS